MKNYELLPAPGGATLVKFNPAAFKASLVCFEDTDPDAVIAFNANYFDQKTKAPIGWFRNGKWIRLDAIPGPQLRPHFEFCGALVQAGPTLFEEGNPDWGWRLYAENEKFRPDALRKAAHNALGETEHDKIVVGHFPNHTLDQIAQTMRKHCVRAMKCDGGGSAYLKVGEIVRGERLYCGVELRERRK
jgi:hypothetical protein